MISVQPIWHLTRSGVGDGRELVVTLPMRMQSEANMRESWRARHRRRKQQRATTALVLTGLVKRDNYEPPCVATIIRVAPYSLDDDNLVGAAKAFRDGIADALGVDDRDPRVTWQYGQRKGDKPRQYAVEVRLRKGGAS